VGAGKPARKISRRRLIDDLKNRLIFSRGSFHSDHFELQDIEKRIEVLERAGINRDEQKDF
jgi:hypothetical protein